MASEPMTCGKCDYYEHAVLDEGDEVCCLPGQGYAQTLEDDPCHCDDLRRARLAEQLGEDATRQLETGRRVEAWVEHSGLYLAEPGTYMYQVLNEDGLWDAYPGAMPLDALRAGEEEVKANE